MVPTLERPKRFGNPILTLSLLASLGAAGCTAQDIEEFLGDVGDVGAPPSGRAVSFEEFSDDVGTRGATESRVLIRTAQGYFEYFGHAAPAGVDLGRQWVIFYTAGTKPTGGYDANVTSLTSDGKSLDAITELVSPGSDCAVTAALTAPYVLIKFAAQGGAAIQFAKRDRVQNCGAPAIRCGGFAGIRCPGAGMCVDDPSDDCDPRTGGTDCWGICQCSAAPVQCKVGASFDASPAVCACGPLMPPPNPCAAILCKAGTHCETQDVLCVTAPCPPIASCVPDAPPPVHCGGFGGFPCPGGGRCIDDPSDSCDPNAGGADCGGICQCIQTVSCIIGATFDSSPAVCTCVPEKPMCGPVCAIFCEFGNVLDAKGCPTCACNPAPSPPAR